MASMEDVSTFQKIAIFLGVLALVLALLSIWQSSGNRDLQQQLSDGQERLQKAQALTNLDNNLVQAIAKSAIDNNDSGLRNLLQANGVTLKENAKSSSSSEGKDSDKAKASSDAE